MLLRLKNNNNVLTNLRLFFVFNSLQQSLACSLNTLLFVHVANEVVWQPALQDSFLICACDTVPIVAVCFLYARSRHNNWGDWVAQLVERRTQDLTDSTTRGRTPSGAQAKT